MARRIHLGGGDHVRRLSRRHGPAARSGRHRDRPPHRRSAVLSIWKNRRGDRTLLDGLCCVLLWFAGGEPVRRHERPAADGVDRDHAVCQCARAERDHLRDVPDVGVVSADRSVGHGVGVRRRRGDQPSQPARLDAAAHPDLCHVSARHPERQWRHTRPASLSVPDLRLRRRGIPRAAAVVDSARRGLHQQGGASASE